MWIPVIVILWQIGPAQAWLNFPQPTFPFETLENIGDIKKITEYLKLTTYSLDPQFNKN